MPYRSRIATLKESHRLIDESITEKSKDPTYDELKLNELKKKKLQYKDEIRRLEKLQWEYEHDSHEYDDDR